mmetsp:Transcript_11802/g.33243  ORF Transcript_11802/g.33243 Transcript_11802/m.33243 type:complete len:215 (-) Transcript_11802:600-1244(-)
MGSRLLPDLRILQRLFRGNVSAPGAWTGNYVIPLRQSAAVLRSAGQPRFSAVRLVAHRYRCPHLAGPQETVPLSGTGEEDNRPPAGWGWFSAAAVLLGVAAVHTVCPLSMCHIADAVRGPWLFSYPSRTACRRYGVVWGGVYRTHVSPGLPRSGGLPALIAHHDKPQEGRLFSPAALWYSPEHGAVHSERGAGRGRKIAEDGGQGTRSTDDVPG